MVGFFLLAILSLHYSASATNEEQDTCGIDGVCTEPCYTCQLYNLNDVCCPPNEICGCLGCWDPNLHGPQCPACPSLCPEIYDPVCGVNNETYANKCFSCPVEIACYGECPCKGPSCPLQKTVGETCYVREENNVDTSSYDCTANCTYKKVELSNNDEERFCFKPGGFPVRDYVCNKYPPIVESGETLGEDCNRDCTGNNENKTCAFTFYIENLKSDSEGRRADGRVRNVTTYNGVLPGPGIVVCEGDTVKLRLMNLIEGTYESLKGHSSGTTLHMHGIRRWNESYEDGVPGINQCEIESGKSFNYTMTAKIEQHENAPAGTYWYHSHVGSQRTNGAEGKLIIMPRNKNPDLYDVDNARNTLFLQEWYITPNNNTPISILINGNGRVGATMNSIPENENWDDYVNKYNLGYQVEYEQAPNPDYNPDRFTTNYSEFEVEEGLRYRFRIIGGISQNFPLLVSIEDHNFTAIATDSIDFEPVEDLQGVWLAAGERYDIVISMKKENIRNEAYKIKVFGHTAPYSPLCTIAWLKYPGQEVDYSYVPPSHCPGFNSTGLHKILNPVRRYEYIAPDNPKYVLLNQLTAIEQQPGLTNTFDTYYVDFINLAFNNLSMAYDDIPFLYQSPAKPSCGPNCTTEYVGPGKGWFKKSCDHENIINPCKKDSTNCSNPDERCQCPHVNHQPHVPFIDGTRWWFETILINQNNDGFQVSHPIHQHGGWYVLLAEEQFNSTVFKINRTWVIDQDIKQYTEIECLEKGCGWWANECHCLPRNLSFPIQKDTIQVPHNGYVIIRTPVDNAGTWIFHCHINHHVESGMAMVLQIGGLGEGTPYIGEGLPYQSWTLGPYEDKKNLTCKQKLNTYQNPGRIDWFYGMKNITACVKPGNSITFDWNFGHNVNNVTKETWENCTPCGTLHNGAFNDTTPKNGSHLIHFADEGTFYFACGVGNNSTTGQDGKYYGYHCKHGGLKAKIIVTKDTETCAHKT